MQTLNVTGSMPQDSTVWVKTGEGGGSRHSEDLAERHAQFESVALPMAGILYSVAFRLTGNTVRAEDLVQETYERAWEKFGRFELGSNFKAWALRILVFVHRNQARKANSRGITFNLSGNESMVASNSEAEAKLPENAVETDWDALYPELVEDEFKRALDRLDINTRAVLMLVTLGELSYKECAKALGIPVGTVMSRLFRARKQLHGELSEYAREKGLLRKS